MGNEKDRLIGFIVLGVLAGGFGLYWAIRGIWWIMPKLIFVGVPIVVLSLVVAGILYLGVLKNKIQEASQKDHEQSFYNRVSFRAVIFIQIFLMGITVWYVTSNIPQIMIDDKGKEQGMVILHPELHHGYNEFAKSWQEGSIFESQSKTPFKPEFFDGSYINLILLLSVGIFGPGLFLFISRKLEINEKNRVEVFFRESTQELRRLHLEELNDFKEKKKIEVEHLNKELMFFRKENEELKTRHSREKAKAEFLEKDQGIKTGAGILDGDDIL
jgi:hypothetical protein